MPDIKNAFNSISWRWIIEQIELKQMPRYCEKILTSLGRLMPNIEGPVESRRRLLGNIVH